ncbi:hypothetical protein BCL57_000608 [Agromyces flavus]|uniref:Uncharacterized protein n=1 Tax=Agromyces flavus TaxID=589382 RepID=A0A1H1XNE9_9MICO|nr:hypothetical protein [Agromyces flavus]MCP2366466.1 hypothetical protein [Agromyces flavus]GGI44732.1 hypothetical protein GCM10010932_06090 [Agromyces flavus]SDT10692.1 hypothetical protein SAMN04489721_2534 [Agromyces flavus]
MHVRSLAIAGALALTATFATAAPAMAAPTAAPDGTNCWGVVSSQAARSDGGLGAHSSAQEEPRLGLGNVARLFGVDGLGGLGSLLASIDGNDATHC